MHSQFYHTPSCINIKKAVVNLNVFNIGDYAMVNNKGKAKYKPLVNTIFQVTDILRDSKLGDKCVISPIENFDKELGDKNFCINEHFLIKMKKQQIELSEEQINKLFGQKEVK